MRDDHADEYLPTIEEDGSIHVTKKVKVDKKALEEENENENENEKEIEEETTTPSSKKSEKASKKREKASKKASSKSQTRSSIIESTDITHSPSDASLLSDTSSSSEETPEAHYQSSLTEIAVSCEKILENPSVGVVRSKREASLLSHVLAFLKDPDERLRQIAMLSLLKVFNDILPVLSPAGIERRTTRSTWPRRRRRPDCTRKKFASCDSTKRVFSPLIPCVSSGVSK